MVIKGLIFDFDGLIIDTETPEYLSWLEIYKEHEAVLAPEEWAACLGTAASAFDAVGLLEQRTGRALNRGNLTEDYRKRALAKIYQQPILPGVREYLAYARSAGIELAVASSSSKEWVASHLARLELSDYFSYLVTRDDVKNVKPDPELYCQALRRLGLQPEQAIALEDSPHGITAARQAGIFCVAVPNPISSRLDLSHASLVIPSLAHMPVDKLIRIASNHHRTPDRHL